MTEKQCNDIYNRRLMSFLTMNVTLYLLDMDTGDTYPLNDEGIFKTVCELLNEQNDEIIHIKSIIRGLYETERTQLGKNTLKQLMEAIE